MYLFFPNNCIFQIESYIPDSSESQKFYETADFALCLDPPVKTLEFSFLFRLSLCWTFHMDVEEQRNKAAWRRSQRAGPAPGWGC